MSLDIPNVTRRTGEPLPEDHHLEYRHDRKTWRMKVTLITDARRREAGRRIIIPLSTGDVVTARRIRDGILVGLSKMGVLSRPVGHDAPEAPEAPSGEQADRG